MMPELKMESEEVRCQEEEQYIPYKTVLSECFNSKKVLLFLPQQAKAYKTLLHHISMTHVFAMCMCMYMLCIVCTVNR
jgi:hypothetical protein